MEKVLCRCPGLTLEGVKHPVAMPTPGLQMLMVPLTNPGPARPQRIPDGRTWSFLQIWAHPCSVWLAGARGCTQRGSPRVPLSRECPGPPQPCCSSPPRPSSRPGAQPTASTFRPPFPKRIPNPRAVQQTTVMQLHHPPNANKQWVSTKKKGEFLGSLEPQHEVKTQPRAHQIGDPGKSHEHVESEGKRFTGR